MVPEVKEYEEEKKEEKGERREARARRYISYARGEVRRGSGGELSTAKAAQGVVCPFTLPSPSAFFCRFSGRAKQGVSPEIVDFCFFFLKISSSFVIYNQSSVKVRNENAP